MIEIGLRRDSVPSCSDFACTVPANENLSAIRLHPEVIFITGKITHDRSFVAQHEHTVLIKDNQSAIRTSDSRIRD